MHQPPLEKTAVGYCLLLPIIILLAGCAEPSRSLTIVDLENNDPAVRILAIKWAGENQMAQAVPLLVDRLQEQDQSVRFFAIQALRRITGTDHGYDYQANAHQRALAVKRWRDAIGNTTNQPSAEEVVPYDARSEPTN